MTTELPITWHGTVPTAPQQPPATPHLPQEPARLPWDNAKRMPRSEVNKRITWHAGEHAKALKAQGIVEPAILDGLRNAFEVGAGLGVKSTIPPQEGRDEIITRSVDTLWELQRYNFLPPAPPESPEELELYARILVLLKQSFAAGFVCGLAGSIALRDYVIWDDTPVTGPTFVQAGAVTGENWVRNFNW